MLADFAKLFIANKQLKEAKQLSKTPRPTRSTPEALQRYLDMAKFESSIGGLPGQGQMEAKMAQQGANAANDIVRTQQSPAAILAGLSAINANQNSALSDLNTQALQYRDSKQGQYYNALSMMANDQLEQWKWNQQDPYLNNMAAASALKNAGLGNIVSGIGGIEQGAVDIAGLALGINKNNDNKTAGEKNNSSDEYYRPSKPLRIIANAFSDRGNAIDTAFYTANNLYPSQQQGYQRSMIAPNSEDDWTLYGEQMKKMYPTASEETLRALLPKFKEHFNAAYYGGF